MKDEIHKYDRSKGPARQGDFFLEAIDFPIPSDATEAKPDRGAFVVAVGETSNHRHQILAKGAKLFERGSMRFIEVTAKGGARLQVTDGAGRALLEPRHHTIELPPGRYLGWTQREWTAAEEVRQVQD